MFLRNQKKKSPDAATISPGAEYSAVKERSQPTVLSEEGLFDIAFENYRKMNPESGMKRRDFRRNIWNSEEVSEYLSDSQYRKYLEYVRGDVVAMEPILVEQAGFVEGPMTRDMSSIGGSVDGMSELEPAYDETFLSDLPVSDAKPAEGMLIAGDDSAFADAEDALGLTADDSCVEDLAVEEVQPELVPAEEVNEPLIDNDMTAGNHMGDDRQVDEGEVAMEPQPEYRGIFAQPGIMEKLRKSIFLNESDDSQDSELLSFSSKEVFEQLLRLEGYVRKIGVISDLAQQIFSRAPETVDNDISMKQDRLMEIIRNAARAIGYLMHFECSDEEEWNNAIASALMLTKEERAEGIIPKQPLNTEYVIECCGMDNDGFIYVRGDYTQICRALFLYEQVYQQMPECSLKQFLADVGFSSRDSVDADEVADIVVEQGKVYLM